MSTQSSTDTTHITEFVFEHIEPLYIFTPEQIVIINRHNQLDTESTSHDIITSICTQYLDLEQDLRNFFNTTHAFNVLMHFNYLVDCLNYDREITRLNQLMEEREALLTEIDDLIESRSDYDTLIGLSRLKPLVDDIFEESRLKIDAKRLMILGWDFILSHALDHMPRIKLTLLF